MAWLKCPAAWSFKAQASCFQDLDTLIFQGDDDSSSGVHYPSEILIKPLTVKDDWNKIYRHLKHESRPYLKQDSDELDFPHVFLVDIDQTLIDTSSMHFMYKCLKMLQDEKLSYLKGSLVDLFISGIQYRLGEDVDFNLETYLAYAEARVDDFYARVGVDIPPTSPYVRQELLDPNIPNFLKKISDRGFVILGFTARDPGSLTLGAEQTERELLDVGINFQELNRGKNLMNLDFEKIQCHEEDKFNYQNFIFYTKFAHKNKYLHIICQIMNRWFTEAPEIFSFHVDDRLEQLEIFPKNYIDSCRTIPVLMENSIRMLHHRIHFTREAKQISDRDIRNLLKRQDLINDIKAFMASLRARDGEIPDLLMSLENLQKFPAQGNDLFHD